MWETKAEGLRVGPAGRGHITKDLKHGTKEIKLHR